MSMHHIEDRSISCTKAGSTPSHKMDPSLTKSWILLFTKNMDPPLWYIEAGYTSHTEAGSTPHLVLGLLVIHDQLEPLKVSVKGPSPKLQFGAAVLRLIQGDLQGLSVFVHARLIGLHLGNLLLFNKNKSLLWYRSWIDDVLDFQCVSEYKSIALKEPIRVWLRVYCILCVYMLIYHFKKANNLRWIKTIYSAFSV